MGPKILKYFEYKHLPERLQAISEPFCVLARDVTCKPGDEDQKLIALQKLLEAKDAAVRACL